MRDRLDLLQPQCCRSRHQAVYPEVYLMDNSIALVILSWITVVSSVVSYHPPMILSVIMSVYFANEIITSYVLVQEKFYKGDDSDSESDEESGSDLPPLIPISELYNSGLRSRFNRDRDVLEQLRCVEVEVAARNAEKEQDATAAAAAYQEAALKAEGEAAEMLNNLGNALMAEHMAKNMAKT